MFRKILIANRGEIAVRILRACRELGIQAVAVYSDVDRGSLHVRRADEAYCIGRGPAQDSYLRTDRIIEVARRSGVDAIHPGYGFLSENPTFAAACEDAGIAFVGPSARTIGQLGDKLAARRLMEKAGVPVLPGSEPDCLDDDLVARAHQIGFPVFIKAAAGGGGKGLRLVTSEDNLEPSLAAARREAMAAFNDDRVYLEKAVSNGRHIEIQILADSYGNIVHLGERECSIQRRHQKLIEEAPSPALDQKLRGEMGLIAVKAAAAAGYVNAGTVEFLLGSDGTFHFLEMNTRLQVEHPVTESVVGIDIVKEQFRIAAGRRLQIAQRDVQTSGWAIECRITAEDPFNRFLPATGRVVSLSHPSGPGVRVDSGIYGGFRVTPHYDSLLAKLIVWDRTREAAISRMRRALREYRIVGLPTSIPFHKHVMHQSAFIQGGYDTSFVARHPLVRAPDLEEVEKAAALAGVLLHCRPTQPSRKEPTTHGRDGRTSMWKLAARREATGQ